MNRHCHRLVYNRHRHQVMAVGEHAGQRQGASAGGTSRRRASAVRIARRLLARLRAIWRDDRARLLSTVVAVWVLPGWVWAQGLPQGGQVVGGQATLSQPDPHKLTVTQQSDRAVIDWGSFSIGQGNTVQFVQPGRNAQTLNRVVGTDASQIHGLLTANGQVFLVNPNGIVFAQGSVVNVGGLIATTRDIPAAAFMAGCQTLPLVPSGNLSAAAVSNAGTLRAVQGYVVLQGTQVRNSGTIEADAGKVVLAAGDRATVALANGQLVSVTLDAAAAQALVQSDGLIRARGGEVLLTSRSANAVLDNAINLSGVVDVSAPPLVSGAPAAMQPAQASGAPTPISSAGRVVIDGGTRGVTNLSGAALDASSAHGAGGAITVTGERVGVFNGSVLNASGATGGGDVKVGGGWQGGDATVANARMTILDAGSRIDASATRSGRGGTVVLWSDDQTRFDGSIAARGGPQGGDGGAVETSGKDRLFVEGRVDASAPNGQAGHWLLDPTDVTIGTSTANATVNAGVWSLSNNAATINATSINADLSAGTSVTVTTSSAGSAAGNITVSSDIVKSGGANATLTLTANNSIVLNANLTSTVNALNVTMTAPTTITLTNSTINLNGGTLTASGGSAASLNIGLQITGNQNWTGDNDTIRLTGLSGNSTGLMVASSARIVQSGNGSVTLNGQSTGNIGVMVIGSIAQTSNGRLNVSGLSDAGYGVAIQSANLTQSGNGSILVVANKTGANGGSALGIINASTLTQSGRGNLTLSGTSSAATGLTGSTSTILQSGSGTLNLWGASPSASGIILSNGLSITQTADGQMNLSGCTAANTGMQITTANITQSGNGAIAIGGTASGAGTGLGVYQGALVTQTGNGSLNLTGVSATGLGVRVWTDATLNQSGIGTMNVAGQSATGNGTVVEMNTTLVQGGAGNLSISGTSNSAVGLVITGSQLRQSGVGNLSFDGASQTGNATVVANTTLLQAGNGSVRLSGVSTNITGLIVDTNATINQTGSGQLSLSGRSASNNIALIINGSQVVQNGNGTLTVSGNSASNAGVRLAAAKLLQPGDGTLNVTGVTTSARGVEALSASQILQSGNGTLVLSGIAPNGTGLCLTGASNLTQSGGGTLTVLGQSTNFFGMQITAGSAIRQTGGGALDVRGNSDNANAVLLSQSYVSQSGNGTLNLSGIAPAGNGTLLTNLSTITQTGAGGRLTVTGQSGSGSGVRLEGNSSIAQTVNATMAIIGSANTGYGVNLLNATLNQSGAGALTVNGTSNSGSAVFMTQGNVTQSGNGNLTFTGVSNASSGVVLGSAAGLIQTGAGQFRVTGNSGGSAATAFGVSVNGSSKIVQNGTGSFDLTGCAAGAIGLLLNVGASVVQSGNGSLNLTGTSNAGQAVSLASSAITQTGSGQLNVTGISQNASAIVLNGTLTQSGNGALVVNGSSQAGQGVWIYGGDVAQSGAGNLRIVGATISGSGIQQSAGNLTQGGAGRIDVVGVSQSSTGSGYRQQGGNITQSGDGVLNLSGQGSGFTGMGLSSANLTQSGNGTLTLTGTSTDGIGLHHQAGFNITQSGGGTLLVTGNAANNYGVILPGGDLSQTGSGQITVSGYSAGRTATFIDGWTANQSGAGVLNVTGRTDGPASTSGLRVSSGTIVQSGAGALFMQGTGTLANGAELRGGSVTQSGIGQLAVIGQSAGSIGLQLNGTSVVQGGGGNLAFSGASTGADGLRVDRGGVSQTGNGSAQLTGTSVSGSGLRGNGGAWLQSGAGAWSASGASTNGQGVLIAGTNVTLGNASVSSSSGGINATSALNVSGAFALSATGARSQVSAMNAANQFSGTVSVAQGSNVSLTNAGALSLGAVSASGAIAVSTQTGDLTLNGNVASSGGSVTLVAGVMAPNGSAAIDPNGDVRRGGAQAITAGAGRTVVIYSGNPDTIGPTGLGSLIAATADGTSGVNKYYDTNVSAGPGTGQIDAGAALNVFYRVRPTLSVTSSGASKVYGQDDPSLPMEVTGLVDGDTVTSIGLSGTLGRVAGESVGSRALTLGNLSGGRGYSVGAQGQLAITAATLNVTAVDQSKVYGSDDPTLTYVVQGGVNRAVQSVDASGARVAVVIDDATHPLVSGNLGRAAGESVGDRAIFNANLSSADGNYVLGTVTNGTLSITQATLTAAADNQSKVYGNDDPALSYTVQGVVNRTVQSVDATGARVAVVVDDSGHAVVTGNLGRAVGESVGDRAIFNANLASADSNYAFGTVSNGTLAITPAMLSVTVDNQSKTYGTDDPTLTYSAQGAVNRTVQSVDASGARVAVAIDDTGRRLIGGNLGRAGGEGVGSRAIFNGNLASVDGNYVLGAVTNATLAVTPATVQVSIDDQTRASGAVDPALTFTTSGLVDRIVQTTDASGARVGVRVNDSGQTVVAGSLSRDPGEQAGAYAIHGADWRVLNPDYQMPSGQVTPGTLRIEAPPPPPPAPVPAPAPAPVPAPAPAPAPAPGKDTSSPSGLPADALPAGWVDAVGAMSRLDLIPISRAGAQSSLSAAAMDRPRAPREIELTLDLSQGGPPADRSASLAGALRLPALTDEASVARDQAGAGNEGPSPAAEPASVRLRIEALFRFSGHALDDLLPEARVALDRWIDDLRQRGGRIVKIRIEGNADHLGRPAFNQRLSELRAQAIERHLRDRGVTGPMVTTGYGSARPVAACADGVSAAAINCLQPDRRVSVEAELSGSPSDQ